MHRFLVFLGRHTPEFWALFSSTLILLVGSYLAWFVNPSWLNRAGALVIIVGVLLAASRFHEWVQQKAASFIDANYGRLMQHTLASLEKEMAPLSREDHEGIKARVLADVQKDLAEIFEGDKRRIRAWEVFLVVVGTFLYGYGDYIISVLKGT